MSVNFNPTMINNIRDTRPITFSMNKAPEMTTTLDLVSLLQKAILAASPPSEPGIKSPANIPARQAL